MISYVQSRRSRAQITCGMPSAARDRKMLGIGERVRLNRPSPFRLLLDNASALWHNGPQEWQQNSIALSEKHRRLHPVPHDITPPCRRTRRSLKRLTSLAGGYLLTAASFLLAVMGVVQRTYSVTVFGICAGVFIGLGCVLLTRQMIQVRQRQTHQPLAFSEDDDAADNPLDSWLYRGGKGR